MTSVDNKRWTLANYGEGKIKESDFKFETQELPELGEGEVRIKNVYTSCDPTQIGWSRVDTYLPKVAIGEVMRACGSGICVASKNSKFSVGDHVVGLTGFQQYYQGSGEGLNVMPSFVTYEQSTAVLNHIGLTAYYIVKDGQPKAGETVVVSGASGAVGSLVCQIAKNVFGCKVIGLAGSQEKIDKLKSDWGCDASINYKTEDLNQALSQHCPDGIDIYWENVGGKITEAVYPKLNLHARVIVCGMISTYERDRNQEAKEKGIVGLPLYNGDIIIKRIQIKGILVSDLMSNKSLMMKASKDLIGWMRDGKLTYRLDVLDGVENCIKGLQGIFEGDNIGKRAIKMVDTVPEVGSFGAFLARQALPYIAGLVGIGAGLFFWKKRQK